MVQFGLSRRKILLWTPTCLADLVPTTLAMATFDEGPCCSRASMKRACSAGVHSLGTTLAAASALSLLASGACRFLTCWPRERLEGRVSLQ